MYYIYIERERANLYTTTTTQRGWCIEACLSQFWHISSLRNCFQEVVVYRIISPRSPRRGTEVPTKEKYPQRLSLWGPPGGAPLQLEVSYSRAPMNYIWCIWCVVCGIHLPSLQLETRRSRAPTKPPRGQTLRSPRLKVASVRTRQTSR